MPMNESASRSAMRPECEDSEGGVVAACHVSPSLALEYAEGCRDGYHAGGKVGYHAGFEQGRLSGWSDGYSSGYWDAVKTIRARRGEQ